MLQSRNVLLIACAVLMVTAVLANAAVKYINLQVLIENDRRVAHTREVKDRLNEMLKNFLDCESSVRGYVLGGREDFLKPYHAAIERVEREFRGVSNLVSDNPEQLGAMAELRKNYDAHQEFLRDILTAHRESGEQTAREIVRTGRGKAIMDEMRRRILEMTRHEDTLLETREQTAKEGLRRALLSGAIGTVLSLAIALAAIVVVSQELYRRRAAEELLKTQIEETRINAERFRLLTQSVPVCIWTARPDGSVTFLNERWRSYTGLPIDESGCATWLDAIHPDDADRLSEVWDRAEGRGDDLYAQEVRVRRGADQTYRWHHCSIVPIRTRRGELQSWVGSLTDVQDQKDQADALEQAVRFRTQELRRANNALQEEVLERIRAEDRVSAVAAELRRSNEELEKFAYVASHDLQEPLRKIQAFGDRLLRKCRDQLDEAGHGYLDRMLAAATRMRTLIDDLLVFSRVATQTRPYVLVDLHATVSEIVADLEAAVQQSGGRVELRSLPTVEADPMQMRQLFQNLIGNALKFAKPELPPAVVIDAEPLAAVPATADPPAPSFPGWRIRVADNGIGFDQIHERRIFELFQRLHGREQFAGTGIGLAICRKIVERHGGVMHARSAEGRGATFIIDLPEAPTPVFVPPVSTVAAVGASIANP
jgi:PAS domain S-box-containing protein